MNIERLSKNTVKLSISFEELHEKGFAKKQMVEEDAFFWHELFEELIEEIEKRYHFAYDGPVAIEIHTLTEEEVTLIFTLDFLDNDDHTNDAIEELHAGWKREFTPFSIYKCTDFEEIIQLAQRIAKMRMVIPSRIFWKDPFYYVAVDYSQEGMKKNLEPVILEYAERSRLTIHYLEEYGKIIFFNKGIENVYKLFPG
ncbi:adaptor protein MecA [Bacillus smithii]|uniref:adaptor protein MecA n=1 Tax=Bacillus smithii TaxID=1479 RepID=UPI003D196146